MGLFLLQQSKSFYFNNKKIGLNGLWPLNSFAVEYRW